MQLGLALLGTSHDAGSWLQVVAEEHVFVPWRSSCGILAPWRRLHRWL